METDVIYTSAALAYMHDNHGDIPAIAMVRGDIMRLTLHDGCGGTGMIIPMGRTSASV